MLKKAFAFVKKPVGLILMVVLCVAVVVLFVRGCEDRDNTPQYSEPTYLAGDPTYPTETQVPPETEEVNPPPTETTVLDSDAPESDEDNSTD